MIKIGCGLLLLLQVPKCLVDVVMVVVGYLLYASVYIRYCIIMYKYTVLVFSKCFRAGFGAFSTFKFKGIEGTN